MRENRPLALAPTVTPASLSTTASDGDAAAFEAERLPLGTVVGGRYLVEQFVAEGAFGAVYRAADRDIPGHVVALKVMHRVSASREETARCLREVQLIAAVSHPSVVSFRDHGLHCGRFYIVMPWYDGETLTQRLARGRGLERREAVRIFSAIAEALAAMHERGIRHQDVKPDNILLARLGAGQHDFPILLDLGVGAFAEEQLPAFTPAYVAPEMARAHLEQLAGRALPAVDGKADVFALGLTLFDALCPGQRDLSDVRCSEAALRRRAEEGVALPDHPAVWDLLPTFQAWLAVDSAARPSAAQFAKELAILTRAEDRRAERRRVIMLALPPLTLVLCVAFVLALLLRDERVSSRVKDRRIEQQAQAIDEAQQAIDALGSGEDYLTVARRNEALRRRLSAAREKREVLSQALQRVQERAASQAAALRDVNERVVMLERELGNASALQVTTERSRQAMESELTRTRQELEAALMAAKREKGDLALLVRELVGERDRLSERLSALIRHRAALLARRGGARARGDTR